MEKEYIPKLTNIVGRYDHLPILPTLLAMKGKWMSDPSQEPKEV